METRSFVRFARHRMAGYCRLCGRPDLARACLANHRYNCGLVRSRSGTRAQNELTLLRNLGDRRRAVTSERSSAANDESGVFSIGGTRLISIGTTGEVVSQSRPLEVQLRWKFQGERDVFPWMLLRLSRHE